MRFKGNNTIMMPLILSLLSFFILPLSSPAQRKAPDLLAEWHRSMIHLDGELVRAPNQLARYELNDLLYKGWETILSIDNSINYRFDSLRSISVLTSPDKNCRIVCWTLLHDDGSCMHFGFIQAYSKAHKKYNVYPLIDHRESIQKPETKSLTPDNWYGAWYYDLIQTKHKGNVYYTLLGWDKNNLTTQKKVIDVVTINHAGKVKFGYMLFQGEKRRFVRQIFEYSSTATMLLRYEKQVYTETVVVKQARRKAPSKKDRENFRALKKELKPTRKTIEHTRPMIVFDKLLPLHPNATGVYSMYVADGDSHNSYVWDKGRWKLISSVQGRNPAPPKNTKPVRKVEYNLLPPPPPKTN